MSTSLAEQQSMPADPAPRDRKRRAGLVATTAERALDALGRSKKLERVGKLLERGFGSIVRPGFLKDALSGTWMGHPVHPMLTDVVIGAWTSSFVLDLVPGDDAERTSRMLVGFGVVSALPTAVTGANDLADVVRAKDRSIGVAHALGNTVGLCVYTASYFARRRGNTALGKALGLAGAGVMTASGFLGGHLAYRRGIGVDQTAHESPPQKWTPVLDDADLARGVAKRAMVDGVNVMLYRDAERIYALANTCTHRGGPLHKGRVDDGVVTCPWHLSSFALDDGMVVRGPATAPQPTYDVRVENGKIEVRERERRPG